MIVPERVMRTGRACPAFEIDDDLAESILAYQWGVTHKGYIYRVQTKQQTRSTVLLHREVWRLRHGCEPRMGLDHINRNKTDNRTCNLREATPKENADNRDNSYAKKQPGTGSSVKASGLPVGVFQKQGRRKFDAILKGRFLGSYESAEAASDAYQKALFRLEE